MSDQPPAPRANLVPLLLIAPVVPILLFGWHVYRTGARGQVAASSPLDPLLASPKTSRVFSASAPGAIAPGAGLDLLGGGGAVLAHGGNLLWLSDPSAPRALLSAPDPAINSFAVTSEGLVVATRGDRLGTVSDGAFRESARLPASGMKVEALSPNLLCLYGPAGPDRWAVYLLGRGGAYAKLFTFAKEITAVAGADNGLLFASQGGIYRVEFGSRLLPVLYLPSLTPIRALAFDAKRQAVFFATAEAVYLAAKGRARTLLSGTSGSLRWRDGSLYAVSEAGQEVLRVDGIFKD